MHNDSDTTKFLQAIFPDYGSHAIFAHSLNPRGMAHTRDVMGLDATRDCYWSIASFQDDGDATRTLAKASKVRALVVDDVGTKVSAGAVELGLGAPTAKIETSARNFQWVYRLASPVEASAWPAVFAEVEALIGMRLEGRDAVHLFRLPCGVNTKKGRGKFAVRLSELNSGIELSLTGMTSRTSGAPASGPGPSDPTPRVQDIGKLLELIPNDDVDYDAWIARAHQVKALALDEEDGARAFDAWSRKSRKYDADETARRWATVSPTRTAGLTLLMDAEAADRTKFEKTMNAEAAAAFDDDTEPPLPVPKTSITATPYQWMDPDKIPPRDWLYGRILIRKFISMTVAPGGVGKSSLIAVETLAQVTGRDLLGERPSGELRVWLWNLEDPREETTRKIQAAAAYYGIDEAALGDRLFVDSGRDQRLVVAEMDRTGPMIVRPVIGALVSQIKLRKIDVVVIDPFVSCHEVPENDNTAQDMVVKEWGRVAELGGCAVHLVDHTRKAPVGTEVNTESSRGAKAKTDAARVVRVVNRMTDGQSKPWGVVNPWRYFSTFNDKANMAPPVDRRDWFYLESVPLGNGGGAQAVFGSVGAGAVQGDDVGVVRRWMPPSFQDLVTGANFKALVEAMGTDEWLKAPQAGEKWIGNVVAKVASLDPKVAKDRKTIKEVIEQWFKAGLLKEVMQQDENRMQRKFIKIAGGF